MLRNSKQQNNKRIKFLDDDVDTNPTTNSCITSKQYSLKLQALS